ncbi:MAG: dTMP kinase [Acidobacteria bacterium]|nr:dTMP kinase [Acidobacteriota bacterium]
MGLFITFEGMDGCGKSTQMRLLGTRLRKAGRNVVESSEPGGTAIGRQIRRILLDAANHALSPTAEMLLYFACRAQNVDELIRPALDRNEIVLSDRFTDSTLAYQGSGRGLGAGTVSAMHQVACRGLDPDLTILIDIDLETSLARTRGRKQADRMEQQRVEFHARVRGAYLELAAREPARIRTIDGRASIEEVARRVWEVVSPHV